MKFLQQLYYRFYGLSSEWCLEGRLLLSILQSPALESENFNATQIWVRIF